MVKYLLRVQVARVRFPPKPPFLESRKKRAKKRKGKVVKSKEGFVVKW